MRAIFLNATMLCFFLSSVQNAGNAQGAIVLQLLNTQVTAGGTGVLDVMISGNGDLLESAALQLQIHPVNGALSSLQFRNPQIINFDVDPNYLFVGNSFNQLFNIDPRAVSQTILQNDTFSTNDSTGSVSNLVVTTSRLLARVDLQHVIPHGTDPSTVSGDLFRIDVTLDGTSFRDERSSLVNFSSAGPAVVSIAAVPEPSAATLVIACIAPILCFRRMRTSPKIQFESVIYDKPI